ncbi:MAG: tetratricopeptide repeat protein, partial [Thermoanaerobaculia bacterium]
KKTQETPTRNQSQNEADRAVYKRRFEQALRLKEGGRIDDAIRLLERLTREHSKLAPAFLLLAGIYRDQKRFAEAAECFRVVTRLAPDSEVGSLGVFYSLWQLGELEEALEEMRSFLASHESQEYERLLRQLKLDSTTN